MANKKVLIIAAEMNPYLVTNIASEITRALPQYLQENGMELRILLPRFGVINERRHRLHEVVRLSGINIIINDEDYPLIIKVASLPGTKLQVYFLDNEDFFKRRFVFEDEDGKFFKDNAERMSFFCKGVLETVRKFGWPPDYIHCHGWMTSLVPAYLRTAYKKDPVFKDSKVIYSAYGNGFKGNMGKSFADKALISGTEKSDLEIFDKADAHNLNIGAIHFSDGVIKGEEKLNAKVEEAIAGKKKKQILPFADQPLEDKLKSYLDFYGKI